MSQLDLSWTGNQFLAGDIISSLIARQSASICFTRKGPPDAAPLRRAIADRYKVNEDWVATGVGSSQILDCLFRRSRKIFDIIPNFKMAQICARRDNSECVRVPVRDPYSLLDNLRPWDLRADSIIVLSSPRNPFGDVFDLSTIRLLLERCDATVVVDEAYADFGALSVLPLVAEFPHLIVVRTFSKAWGLANLRVGYCVGRSIDHRFRKDFLLPYCVGELSQRVTCALLAEPSPILESIEKMRAAREHFIELLGVLRYVYLWRSETNYVCVEHPRAKEMAHALERALDIKVAILHRLVGFPTDWPTGLRITVPDPSLHQEITNVIATVADHKES